MEKRITKSFLLCGTALSTAAILTLSGSGGDAAEIVKIKLGGYSTQYVGYASQDNPDSGAFTGVDVKCDTEIFSLALPFWTTASRSASTFS